ncbi:Uncharacterised protein [Yokenella regensburgei]|uniref:Uncharacterized protein n=1 Tax=Yokenella regensburgei TaxID=158877 RepID=A0AB38G0Z6_9ENTR|nr:Uncharacterised protein [Yokenella regensburgei]SQA66239.1 Uncharacterised protein [Yokenella regensburgei]SUQ04857.1 Uncharacterised protein [Yokenella regensburgei]
MMQMFKYPHGEGASLRGGGCWPLCERESTPSSDIMRLTPLLSRFATRKFRTQISSGKGGSRHGV